MKKAVAFCAGAAFALLLVVTCGGGSSSPNSDASDVRGLFDLLVPHDIKVGDVHAQTSGANTWQYARIYISSPGSSQTVGWKNTFSGPQGVTLDMSTCSSSATANSSIDQAAVCALNVAGVAGWELVVEDSVTVGIAATFTLKRPTP
jgi:hypothetical protein